jgi:3-hydroxyisobutyrate dehydrogenase-like beta-hydroxyacid dehydrogenase
MAVFAFIGFGELGSSLAEGLGRSGVHLVRAYTRERSAPAAAASLEDRLRRAGAQRCASLEQAVAGATAVLSVVPAGDSRAVAEQCAPLLDRGAFYVDLTASAVAEKQAGAALVAQAGALYVDAAVLGTVATSGFEVPILVSGPGADGWKALVDGDGLVVDVLDAPAGHATLVKLLRSVYMKGRDALILEMMLAARRYGLENRVAESIRGPGEQVPFPALAERVLCALAVHSKRRADELLASSEVVREAGVDPRVTLAGADVLRHLAELDLRERFDRERPSSGDQVLAAIEALGSDDAGVSSA